MKIAPKAWTHHHTQRIYHMSMLTMWMFVILSLVVGVLALVWQSKATTTIETINTTTITALVPGVSANPAVPIVSQDPGGPVPQVPPLTPEEQRLAFLQVQPGSGAVEKEVKISTGVKKTLPVFSSANPSFVGSTNILDPLVIWEIDSQPIIRGTVNTDEKGNFYFKVTEPVSPGLHVLKVNATSSSRPGLSKTVTLDFYVEYAGAPISLPPPAVVTPEGEYFYISLQILDQFKKIYPGEEIFAQLKISRLGSNLKNRNVEVRYVVTDSAGKVVSDTSEMVSVGRLASFYKTFTANNKLEPGLYTLTARLEYGGVVALAFDTFQVAALPGWNLETAGRIDVTVVLQTLLILLFLFAIIAYFEYSKVRQLSHAIKKVGDEDLKPEIKKIDYAPRSS